MHCPSCKAIYEPSAILAACHTSWPNQGWLLFTCPRCDEKSHVAVSDGSLAFGGLDGAPGPAFFADETLTVPGLRVKSTTSAITATLDGKRYVVKARR